MIKESAHSTRWTSGGRRTLRHLFTKLCTAFVIASAVACGSESGTGPVDPVPSGDDPVAGAFVLTTVNTVALPFTLFNDSGYALEIASSTLALQANGQFVLAITTRETVVGFPSLFVDSTLGTWSQNRGAVSLTATGGDAAVATWDGIRLAFPMDFEVGPLALVFRRE